MRLEEVRIHDEGYEHARRVLSAALQCVTADEQARADENDNGKHTVLEKTMRMRLAARTRPLKKSSAVA